MKFIARWTFRLLLLGIVLVVGLVLLKDTLLKSWVENRIRSATGLEVKIGRFEVAIDRPVVRIESFLLYNTAELGGGPLLDIPELHLEYDWEALKAKEIRIKLLRLDLRELNLVEDQKGKTNLSTFIQQLGDVPQPQGSTNKPDSAIKFHGIDTFNLSLGTLRFISLKDPRRNQELKLNLRNVVSQNMRTEQDFMLLLLKVMLRHGLTLLLSPAPAHDPRSTNTIPIHEKATQR